MRNPNSTPKWLVNIVLLAAFSLAAAEQAAPAAPKKKDPPPFTPGGVYRQGDMQRPRPPVVDPGMSSPADFRARPPSDAIVLFDGTDLSAWQSQGGKGVTNLAPRWKVENGYMEVVAKTGGLVTKEKFGDCQLHIEWATPAEVKGDGQGRGNSGVFPFGHGEVQVLDSYQNDTYPDGQAAAIYHRYPPLVNACRKPGEWQTYDIICQAPRFDDQGKIKEAGRITVLHNGVLVHHAVETGCRSKEGPLALQDHGNPVRYRNIWVRKLKPYDEK